MKIEHVKIIDSTNDLAARILANQKDNSNLETFVVRADFQTDGRGQRGNKWHSQYAENLMFSYVFFPNKLEVANQFMLSQIVSVAIVEYLESKQIANIAIKWPNDIYVGMQKICGMLIENSVSGKYIKSCIVGIGININQTDFPDNLPNPTSLKQQTKKEYNLDTEFNQIINILNKHLFQLDPNAQPNIKQNYTKYLLGLNKTLIYNSNGKIFKGIIRDVDKHGFITIENESTKEQKSFDFKEIELIIPEQIKESK